MSVTMVRWVVGCRVWIIVLLDRSRITLESACRRLTYTLDCAALALPVVDQT